MMTQAEITCVESTAEKRRRRIEQLRQRLQKEESRFKASERKKRNGRLISLGLLFEKSIPDMSTEHVTLWLDRAKKFLNERNQTRVFEAFSIGQPNAETLAAFQEKSEDLPVAHSVQELMEELNSDD